MTFFTVSLAVYAGQTSPVCAYYYDYSEEELSDGRYSAYVASDGGTGINMYGKSTMMWGTLTDLHANQQIDELSLPSVIKKDDENHYRYDMAIMSLEYCNCSNIKSLILPDTMMELNMSELLNTDSLDFLTIPSSITSIKVWDYAYKYDFTIRGSIGSYAEKFAKEKNIPFVALGDINADNDCSPEDIRQMNEYMYGKSEMETVTEKSADLNFDQKINITDYIMLKNIVIDPPVSSCGASTADALAAPDLNNMISQPCSSWKTTGYESFVADSSDEILLDSQSNNANPVYSPFSIYSALAMAAECAAGNTQLEILDVLHDDNINTLRSHHKALFSSLYFDNFSTYCKTNNSMWLNNMYKYNQKTLENIADYYYAPSFSKDFSDISVPYEISDWIYKNTSGKIKPDIKVSNNDIIKIINTVTFKDKWEQPFGNAEKDTFYLSDGTAKDCDFLDRYSFADDVGFSNNFMKYSIPMSSEYKMNFVLPDENVSVADIVSDKDTMDKILTDNLEYKERKVYFKVPKFNVYSSYDIIPAAKKLGIDDAFGNNADFTGLIDYDENNLPSARIDQIKHEASLLIDEQGCEAAAYTIVSIIPTCPPPPENEPVYFYLDKPFYYYISNSYGMPVFSGIINDPTQK